MGLDKWNPADIWMVDTSLDMSSLTKLKTIDDINSLFPGIKKFQFSLNKFVYSIQNFESMVVFFIDRARCEANEIKINENHWKKLSLAFI